MSSTTRSGIVENLRAVGVSLLMTLAMLVVLESILRVANFRILRDSATERSLTYQYDSEIGWAPVPNTGADVTNDRTIHAHHNSFAA